MNNKRLLPLLSIVLALAALPGCDKPASPDPGGTGSNPTTPAARTKVTIGIQASPAMALVMTAKEAGCFDAEGLDVELQPFTAGKFALQALIGGSLDYCVSGEVPVALATLQGNGVTVLTQVVKSTTNEVRVVARKDDSAANGPAAYFKAAAKRKIATSIGGGPEYYTYVFMNKYGIAPADVEIVAQQPQDMPAALQSSSVDAIAVFDPFAYFAEKRLGDAAVTFADPALYSELYVLDISSKQLSGDSRTSDAILRALLKAQDIVKNDPEKAKAATEKYTKLDRATIDGVWNSFQFEVALTPTLLEYWTAQAEWARKTGKVPPETKTPDYRAIIADGYLRRVQPAAVTIPTR